ncbi:hypothetical protein N7U66_10415 [Lacinutrix neustonica]|uniref:AlgX/AlgJ SGNH hydrolase-like domain-containing protein n=1 Tax=Lacinutrix neustonica TaxID=2980107 RepID=A0A9E8MYA9_9FLAO|nr:hypothetical protein [Lacinutrix neustonica]WAC03788.1 hypothetical protein N7U66_10415 [Lacinutrix neustonica]
MKIKHLCEAENIRLIVTLLPSKIDVNPAFRNYVQELHHLDDETINTNAHLSNALSNWLNEENIEYLNLQPALERATEKVFWDQDLHINTNAHSIIGKLLYKNISPLSH